MSKDKLQVLMLQRVAWVGKQWEIVEVSHTQAKNYLIPKWLARVVTEKEIENLKKSIDNKSKNSKEVIFERHKIAEILHWKEIIFEARWSSEKIFGWIQELDIIAKIEKNFKVKLDKKMIILPEWHHIKKVGKYDIKINLGSDVYIKMSLDLRSIN